MKYGSFLHFVDLYCHASIHRNNPICQRDDTVAYNPFILLMKQSWLTCLVEAIKRPLF